MNKIIFITGGARSGKSTFAEKLAEAIYNHSKEKKKIAYIATGVPFDKEFKKRIQIHREKRSKLFETYEEDIHIDIKLKEILSKHKIFLVECLTTWLGNLFQKKSLHIENEVNNTIDNIINLFKDKETKSNPDELIKFLIDREKNNYNYSIKNLFESKNSEKILMIISNEIGMGIVPDNKLSRDFRDLTGKINQKFAKIAQFVYLTTSGIPNRIK